ncbi:MAG: hypothetical protein AB8B58_03525 [Roseobacter sp.]
MQCTEENQSAIAAHKIDKRHLRGNGLCTLLLPKDAASPPRLAIVFDQGAHPSQVCVSHADKGSRIVIADGVPIAVIAGPSAEHLSEDNLVFIERPEDLKICPT